MPYSQLFRLFATSSIGCCLIVTTAIGQVAPPLLAAQQPNTPTDTLRSSPSPQSEKQTIYPLGTSLSPPLAVEVLANGFSPRKQFEQQTIDLNSVVSDYARDMGIPMDQAWTESLSYCGLSADALTSDSTAESGLAIMHEQVRPGVFRITANSSYFQHLVGAIESLRHGKKQIVVEVRTIRVSQDSYDHLNRDLPGGWAMAGPESKDPSRAASNPFQLPVAEKRTDDTPAAEFVSAVTSFVRPTPCRFAKLNADGVADLLRGLHRDAKTNTLQAPKITMFPGQRGSISDGSQRPFVTSVRPVTKDGKTTMEPVIEVLTEGLGIDLTMSINGNQIDMQSAISFSEIGDVDTFTFVPAGTDEEATIQVPERRVKQVELAQRLDEGMSLLIAPQFYTETSQRKRQGFTRRTVKSREYLLILLTPNLIEG